MFPKFDQEFMSRMSTNPVSFLTALHEFQNANFVAAKAIADNNVAAFEELARIRNPQQFAQMQPAILKAAAEKNIAVLTGLWQSFGVNLPSVYDKAR